VPLRPGQFVCDVAKDGVEHIRDGAERDRHLRFGAARDQHADALPLSGVNALAPQDRLANAGLSAYEERGGAFPKPDGEVGQSRLLPAPPDELEARHCGHGRTVGLSWMRFEPARRSVVVMRKPLVALVLAAVTALTAAAALAGSDSLDPVALSKARTIKAEVSARYVRGTKLAVTEASPTSVLESFLLLTPDLLGLRIVPADNGIHYAICPVRATCPYPGPRAARPANAFNPRREALELALRTFLETSASVVSVSLPTPDYVFFLVERAELRGVDMAALVRALSGNPARTPASSLRRIVDEMARPRLFMALGLEPTPNGRDSLGAVPLRRDA
jgi:hypothetical protein